MTYYEQFALVFLNKADQIQLDLDCNTDIGMSAWQPFDLWYFGFFQLIHFKEVNRVYGGMAADQLILLKIKVWAVKTCKHIDFLCYQRLTYLTRGRGPSSALLPVASTALGISPSLLFFRETAMIFAFFSILLMDIWIVFNVQFYLYLLVLLFVLCTILFIASYLGCTN